MTARLLPPPTGAGVLSFIRYAFMPNHLGYCGGNDNDVLFEAAVEQRPDPGLGPLLAKFAGAFPYLRTIAAANNIADPLDERVVEAYWLGNDLLERVQASAMARELLERFGDRLPPALRDQVVRKAPEGARPYHLFHVLDVYRHLGVDEVAAAAIENCRISWGRVSEVTPGRLVVQRQPLVVSAGRLALGEARAEPVLSTLEGGGFVAGVVPGDWVSVHWGWACEVLDARKLANLQRWSAHHLRLASATL